MQIEKRRLTSLGLALATTREGSICRLVVIPHTCALCAVTTVCTHYHIGDKSGIFFESAPNRTDMLLRYDFPAKTRCTFLRGRSPVCWYGSSCALRIAFGLGISSRNTLITTFQSFHPLDLHRSPYSRALCHQDLRGSFQAQFSCVRVGTIA